MGWNKNKAVSFFLLVFLLILIFILIVLILRPDVLLNKSYSCGDYFQVANSKNFSATKFISCEIYDTTPDTVYLLGKLEDVFIEDSLLVAKIQINESGLLKNYNFILGKLDSSYTWITLKKDKKFYDLPNEFKKLNPIVNGDLLNKLKAYKKSYITFTLLLSQNLTIYKNLLSSPEYRYKDDALFRHTFFSKCNLFLKLPLSLKTIREKCGLIYIHGFTLYKSDLML